MKASDLKALVSEARPVIERMLDDAEVLAGFREAATEKGIDWSQVKGLVKAQILDERAGDGEGKRVNAIIERADNASAYADLLGLAKMNENNFSAEPSQPHNQIEKGADRPVSLPLQTDGGTMHHDRGFAGRSDDLSIPPFLRRVRA